MTATASESPAEVGCGDSYTVEQLVELLLVGGHSALRDATELAMRSPAVDRAFGAAVSRIPARQVFEAVFASRLRTYEQTPHLTAAIAAVCAEASTQYSEAGRHHGYKVSTPNYGHCFYAAQDLASLQQMIVIWRQAHEGVPHGKFGLCRTLRHKCRNLELVLDYPADHYLAYRYEWKNNSDSATATLDQTLDGAYCGGTGAAIAVIAGTVGETGHTVRELAEVVAPGAAITQDAHLLWGACLNTVASLGGGFHEQLAGCAARFVENPDVTAIAARLVGDGTTADIEDVWAAATALAER